MIDRRTFLGGSAALAATPGLLGCGATPLPKRPWFEISLAQWSLHRRLRGEQQPSIDNLDFAATTRGFGIDAVEYVNQFFVDKANDDAYLGEMVRRADGEGVHSLLVMVDGEGALGAPDASHRAKSVERHVRWLHAARTLGCHSIRVNAASEGSRHEQSVLAADGLRRLCQRADEFELDVIVENHGGLSSDGSWLAELIRLVDHPRAGTLPDFGNFRIAGDEWYDRYRGVEQLMPYARAVSAKSHAFDANGDEEHTDFERMLRIVLEAGYRGYVGIEFEGAGSEDAGILATKSLLERVRARIVA